MKGGDLYKKAIPKQSKRRKKEQPRYLQQIKDFWAESVENKTNFCFFCGEFSDKMLTIHHLKGRTGDYYLDKEFFVWGHSDCHVSRFHHSTVEDLITEPWYQDFLARLKEKDEGLWYKQIKKEDKAKGVKRNLFDEEID